MPRCGTPEHVLAIEKSLPDFFSTFGDTKDFNEVAIVTSAEKVSYCSPLKGESVDDGLDFQREGGQFC